jgi:predicted ribosomally synthesized peptide with SipW-like signal peptide
MRRSVLLTIAALGVVMTLVGAAGVLSVFTDQAKTGTNKFETGSIGSAADLKIAAYDTGTQQCGTFTDDLTTGIFDVTGAQSSPNPVAQASVCLRNDGTLPAGVNVVAIELQDIDFDCTGDEATVDTSCGADGAGEVASSVTIRMTSGSSCPAGGLAQDRTLTALTSSPLNVESSLAPGAQDCTTFEVIYQNGGNDVIKAQSDRATWRFAFDATSQ